MGLISSIAFIAAAVVPASPIEANTWFTSKEHPKTALSVAERGGVAYRIDVAPDGTPLRCTTQEDAPLDRKVCELLMKRARFQPARDDQGRPAFGLYEGVASFLLPGKGGRPDRAKRVIAVDRLPEGVAGPAWAKVAFLVDAAGAVSHCASTPGERRRFMQTVEALGPAACADLARDYRPIVARDAGGAATASVQSVMVRFEVR